jgi:hypothetical protein
MKIVLQPHVAMALETIKAQTRGKEASGFGWGTFAAKGVFEVYDYVVLNVGSETYTEIGIEDQLKLMDREDAANMRLWWHIHPVGNGVPGPHNWSGTDNNTIMTSPLGGVPELIKWSASIVRTPRGWVGRFDRYVDGAQTVHCVVEPFVPEEVFNVVDKLLERYVKGRAKWLARYSEMPEVRVNHPKVSSHQMPMFEDEDDWQESPEGPIDWIAEYPVEEMERAGIRKKVDPYQKVWDEEAISWYDSEEDDFYETYEGEL